MFATDPKPFSEVAWLRRDFSDEPIPDLLASLKHQNPPQGIDLPPDSRALGVVLKPDRPQPTVRVVARVKDANGRYASYRLGTLNSGQWSLMETAAGGGGRRSALQASVPPLSLVSIAIEQTDFNQVLQPGSLLIDYVQVTLANGVVQVVEPFDDVSGWNVLRASLDANADQVQSSELSRDGTSGSLVFVWSEGRPLQSRGVFHGPPISALPVLASKSFIKKTGHSIGSEFDVSVRGRRVLVTPVDVIDYFPTLDTVNESWLIADLASLIKFANLEATFGDVQANEVWLSTPTSGSARKQLVGQLAKQPFTARVVRDRESELANSKVDPLVQAGWRALLLIVFAAVLGLSCMGFLVHAYVSFRNREGQFALLRTIGLSTKQLVVLVWLEQALVIGAGMALGTWMGGRLGATIMPYLGHDDLGGQVLPPFAIEVNWGILAATYLAMALVLTTVILGVIYFIQRISLQRVLRLGDF